MRRHFGVNWNTFNKSRNYTKGVRNTGFLAGKDVLVSDQFTRDNLEEMLDKADWMKNEVEKLGTLNLCKDKLSANLFYEASTRTNSSFYTAMQRLGGSVLPVYTQFSSVQKGETLEDTIKVLENYVDIIIMRHPEPGSVAKAADVARIPVVNAGDGPNEHPTQALLDLFCIQKEQGKLDGLSIAMVGDLKYGRTVHSLSKLLSHFNVKLYFVSPPELEMPHKVTHRLDDLKVKYETYSDLNKVMPLVDIVYMTRIQKERFSDVNDYDKVKNSYIMDPSIMSLGKKNMILMHPLPRVNEITVEVDQDPRAKYFLQPKYGMYMRMAILASCLGKC